MLQHLTSLFQGFRLRIQHNAGIFLVFRGRSLTGRTCARAGRFFRRLIGVPLSELRGDKVAAVRQKQSADELVVRATRIRALVVGPLLGRGRRVLVGGCFRLAVPRSRVFPFELPGRIHDLFLQLGQFPRPILAALTLPLAAFHALTFPEYFIEWPNFAKVQIPHGPSRLAVGTEIVRPDEPRD